MKKNDAGYVSSLKQDCINFKTTQMNGRWTDLYIEIGTIGLLLSASVRTVVRK